MSPDPEPEAHDDSLVSHLRVIEQQPLADRASGYAALHEQLTKALDGAGGRA